MSLKDFQIVSKLGLGLKLT